MKSPSSVSILPAVLALAAVTGILFATPHGIGLSPDSIGYVGGARNIIDGKGFTMPPSGEPITHHAPFYSFLLATLALIGPEPAQGARWLGSAFFGLNIILMWRLASQTRGQVASAPVWVPAGIAGLMLTAPAMWEIHLMAWTEPAYISLCLIGLWRTAVYLGSQRRAWLVAAGASVGLAAVTRYAGLSMWVACCLALLFFGRRPVARRLADVVVFSAFSIGPLVLWAGRNFLSAGTAVNRPVSFHPIGKEHFREALATAASWLLVPEHASGWAKVAVIAALGAAMVAGIYLRLRATAGTTIVWAIPDVVKVTLVAAVAYPLFLALSVSLIDANTPLDVRILSPLFVLLLILAAFGLHSWDAVIGGRRTWRLAAVLAVCLVCPAYFGSSASLITRSYREGLGFNSLRWTDSRLVRALREMPSNATIYSNAPEALYYHTGRGAKRLPAPFSRVTRRANPDYQQELAAVSRDLEMGGVLVYFNLGTGPAAANVELPIRTLELVPLRSYPDGTIYMHSRAGEA